jgi:osmoprotectant transport system permease protein
MQTIVQVEFPLALPVIVAGVRTASVEIIASASLAVLIGGGGLGNYIMNGIAMFNVTFLMLGAVPIALLAIVSEVGFSLLLKRVTMYTS